MKFLQDNVLNVTTGLICHQVNSSSPVNCELMTKYPQAFSEYEKALSSVDNKWKLLGKYQIVEVVEGKLAVVNIFSLFHSTVEYSALHQALKDLADEVDYNVPLYFPNDFDIVVDNGNIAEIIADTLGKHNVIICTN
jgi:hypothetical protein